MTPLDGTFRGSVRDAPTALGRSPPSSAVPPSCGAPRSRTSAAYAADFRYAMEETDLALRLVDRDWTIRYDATPAVVHPRTDPARHPGAAERTMRNRVWLAYRNLPTTLALVLRRQLVRRLGVASTASRRRPRARCRRRMADAPSRRTEADPLAHRRPPHEARADPRFCETGSVTAMTGADDAGGPLSADERAALIAAHERRVEALRNSAQYRVGELVIAGARSPRRLVRLPVDLWRLRKELLARLPRHPARHTIGAAGPRRRRRDDPRRAHAAGARPGVG